MKLFGKKSDTMHSIPGSPPAVWASFERQTAYKSWVIAGLVGLLFLSLLANIKLASRPPEYVVVDGTTGDATLVKHSLSNDALLRFIAEKTKPPKLAIVRFTREFLHLALAVNSSTIEKNWPAALSMMSPALRTKLEAEAAAQKLVETYKLAERKTDLDFESLELTDRSDTLLAVRATIKRRVSPLLETGQGPRSEDRIKVDVVLEMVPPTVALPDGLRVLEWRLAMVENASAAAASPTSSSPAPGGSRAD